MSRSPSAVSLKYAAQRAPVASYLGTGDLRLIPYLLCTYLSYDNASLLVHTFTQMVNAFSRPIMSCHRDPRYVVLSRGMKCGRVVVALSCSTAEGPDR